MLASTRLRSRAASGVALGVVVFGVAVARSVAAAPAPGEVLFSGNWETGNIDQWTWSAQCANVAGSDTANRPDRGTVTLVTSPVAQGRYAARFELPAYESPNACEVLRHRLIGGDGTDEYYALEVLFPNGWREPSSAFWGLSIAQFNYVALTGAPVGLGAHRNHVNLTMQTGAYGNRRTEYSTGNDDGGYNIRCRKPSGQLYPRGHCTIVPDGKLVPGAWHQLIVHVRWAADASGLVEGWFRLRRQRWKKTVVIRGYPTRQWDGTGPNGTYSLSHDSSDKIGAYRGAASFPISVMNDGFCAATALAAAKSCFR